MNNNAFEVLADGSEEGELFEVDSFKFTGLVPDAKVSIQDKNFSKTDYPSTVSLLACSGKYGYVIIGHVDGFVFAQTQSLRSTVYATEKGSTSTLKEKTIIPLALPAHQLRLSCDELTILAALSDGSILSYSVTDILEQKENVQPKHSIRVDTPIIDLRPNTEASPDLACVLLKDNQCRIINWKSGDTVATMPGSDFSAICWSPKGKQLVCGRLDGTLEHYDLSGSKKDSLNSPESMQAGYGDENVNRNVQDVLWIENHQFLVLYSRPTEPNSDEFINDAYIIDRKPKTGTGPKYTHLAEVTPIFSPEGRSNHFYMETIRGFGAQFPHVVILANGATNELSVVGENEDGNWATWDLPENGMASLPLSEETNCDTFPLGLALDYSATEKLPPYDASESDAGVEPVPVLYHLNDEGHIGSYHCYNEHFASSGIKYQGMKSATTPSATLESTPVQAPSTTSATSTTSTPNTTASAFDTKPSSSLSTSAFSSSPFGVALGSGSSGTSFASLTKVQGATTPSFGGSQGFASLAQNKAPNAVTPTFGSTTSFGAGLGNSAGFGSSSPAPAFGSTTSFGSLTKKDNAPTFGTSTSFGSMENKTSTPVFGSATGFGSMTKKDNAPTFGTSTSFGSMENKTSTPVFGSATGLGSTDKKQNVPAFGSTTGFGQPAKKDETSTTTLPFGPTGFGSSSAEENNDSATPKSGSTSSFEIVSKNDTIQDNSEKEIEDASSVPLSNKDQDKPGDEKPAEQEPDILEKDEKSDVPSFDALTIDYKDKQESAELKKVDINEKKVLGYELDDGKSDTDESEELVGEKAEKDVEAATKKEEAATTTRGLIPGIAPIPSTNDTTTTTTTPITTSATAATTTTTSSTGFSGFGALAKNTIPGAVNPTFGSTTGFGSGSSFSALSKNTVSGATTPAFGATSGLGSTSGFSALAKNTVPGAKAPAFGSASTLGGTAPSGFGALAKNTVPGAVAPAFGSTSTFGRSNNATGGFGTTSFGAEKPTTTPSPTTKTATIQPTAIATVSAAEPPTTLKTPPTTQHITQPTPLKYATPKEKQESKKEEPVAEKLPVPKPEPKEEGMAKQFEALYFKITADLEKLSSLQSDLEKELQTQNKRLNDVNKSVEDLTSGLDKWRLGECGQIGNIADDINDQLKKNDISGQKNEVSQYELKTSELMNRKNQIEECLNTKEDPEMLARLADRELDDATREDCEYLELRCKNTGDLLGELEYRIVNKTKQQRKPVQSDTSNYSFYDFHCAIRDVERDLKRKDAEVKDLEQKLLLLKFKEHQRVAENSPSAITFEDLTDEEYADALSSHEPSGSNNNLGGQFTKQHIDYTVKYLQDEQVMDQLCTLTNQQSPCCISADTSKQ
ncbi:hypothetical protein BCR42DRAFT_489862 [Absidia repens]|uniref:Nucleoporin Nup159/Nup146 N-terminal domain-containing protein n=1 Tax=Absidia repens TaxID=90262 RepID=A0A1X2IL57_9FUNG|nr:hypothetical protein BCR42DRAFT_489862 [Absidia repens]